MNDAFEHHPELRSKIAEPLTSYFRTFSVENVLKQQPQLAQHRSWLRTDEDRERTRTEVLKLHNGGDLWIFAYGSLMWDPALRFVEVRRAFAADHARRFILLDKKGGRGTEEAPGLMAALDEGTGCEGLAFRIAEEDIETETEILWRREMIGPSYVPTLINVTIAGRSQKALTFVADHTSNMIVPALTRADQVRYIASGKGFLGTSKSYLENIVKQFDSLGIVDQECTDLLRDVEIYMGQQK